MPDPDELIYQNANMYRLHADNLRWSLLGGFAAFLAAVFSLSQSQVKSIKLDSPFLAALAFLISFSYLWVLAIQNWFYNLFAQFVDDCESRIINKQSLRSLQSFAKERGCKITPFHPSFFLSELIVASVAYYFLCISADNIFIPRITDFIYSMGPTTPIWLKGGGYLIYMLSLHLIFKNWDSLVYRQIIERLSNLYKPVSPG